MTKAKWAEKIRVSAQQAGTYREYFEDTILTLSAILEKRDQVEKAYQKDGRRPVIEYTNKAGATNLTKTRCWSSGMISTSRRLPTGATWG